MDDMVVVVVVEKVDQAVAVESLVADVAEVAVRAERKVKARAERAVKNPSANPYP